MENQKRDDGESLKSGHVPLEDDKKQLSQYLNRISRYKLCS